jgi:large subunit ribosomal protein L24
MDTSIGPLHNRSATSARAMQKVLQRTVRAERVALRKKAKLKEHEEKGASWSRFQRQNALVRKHGANIKAARINRAADWDAGNLAARRDVGANATTYGAVHVYDINTPELNKDQRPKWFPIVEGDRVVVVKGRDKGRIGDVTELLKEQGTVRVKGVNLMDIIVPTWMQQEQQLDGSQLSTFPKPVPLEDVRLVYPLPHPETGVPRDVLIERLVNVNWQFDKTKKEWTQGDRVVAGTNTIIPWPETGEEAPEDHDEDTLRINVEEPTFRPFLMQRPMPETVIDELRNKYSRFRTRHTYQYLDEKEAEDAKAEKRKELAKTMRTPLQQLAESRAKERLENEKELSEEQLAKIGAVIASEKAKAVDTLRALPRR